MTAIRLNMKIAIIGAGNMGYAYARSLTRNNIISKEDLYLVERSEERQQFLKERKVGNVLSEFTDELTQADIVILAVKPQSFKEVALELKSFIRSGHLLISIMAGIKIDTIKKALQHDRIIRAMPNTPSQIGLGVTGYYATENITTKQLSFVDTLLKSNGSTILLDEEDKLDAVTALSGSGPAYFFYFMKSLIEAGKKMGLDENTASLLAQQTMNGSYHLMMSKTKPLDELIAAVTSKGGTTEAALKKFNAAGLDQVIIEALEAARNRAEELSKMLDE